MYNAKCFMSMAIEEAFYQAVSFTDGNDQQFFSLRYFEIMDKLVQSPKFQRAIYKGPLRQVSNGSPQTNKFSSNKMLARFAQQPALNMNTIMEQNSQTIHEIEEESSTNQNNGLPKARFYHDITRNMAEVDSFFFLF